MSRDNQFCRFIYFFFFFSSRRRHTRSLRDWSSDVCSSDLLHRLKGSAPRWAPRVPHLRSDYNDCTEKELRVHRSNTPALLCPLRVTRKRVDRIHESMPNSDSRMPSLSLFSTY